ncbi:MAG: zinc-dependent alcohol dehydrogenase family protein, partial [Planctomycetota bacterium]|nr:zinc-dependent alcohol dehydrogenase family protein [Planctomycetota bacterium]
MKAVQFQQPGEPTTVLKTIDIERPVPRPGEVLVRMLATPINPSDLMYIRRRYTVPAQCPATPGFEGVGVVESSGGGLRGRLFMNRRVVVLNRRGGNWAEYAVVPVAEVIPISNSLSLDQAATFFVNPATAWVMTREVLKVPQGQWLIQTAAGSALGRMIIRLGQATGFRTFNIVRRDSQADELRRLGADHVEVFDESRNTPEELSAAIRKTISVAGSGAEFVIDAVGGATGSALVQCLGQKGRMLAYGTLSNEPLVFSPRVLMTTGSKVEGFWLGSFMSGVSLPFKLRLVHRLTKLIQSGVLSTRIAQTYTLDQISDAVKAAEDSAVSGKVLLRMAES